MAIGNNIHTIRQPVLLLWKPKPDITAYELALCLPMFSLHEAYSAEDYFDTLPDEAKRHVETAKP